MARIISLQCSVCNRDFFGSRTRKYCSQDCRSTAIRKGSIVKCTHCGIPIYRKLKDVQRSSNWFCSTKCHYAHGRIDKQCAQCESTFSCTANEAIHRRFCSKRCEGQFRGSGDPVNAICTMCKSEFLLSPSLNNRPGRRYCSRLCYHAHKRMESKEQSSQLCPEHGSSLSPRTKTCKNCAAREWGWKQKLIIMQHYGTSCKCCGETMVEFLTIDHIDNDGAQYRKKSRDVKHTPGGGRNFYREVIKMGFPSNLQVLCLNCNAAKHWYGICPHKQRPAYTQKTLG